MRAIDGDTLRIGDRTYRIAAIDTPERGERGYEPATRAMQRLVDAGPVRCRDTGERTHGRIVAVCEAGGVDLGREMVRLGLAHACAGRAVSYADLPNGLANPRKRYCRER